MYVRLKWVFSWLIQSVSVGMKCFLQQVQLLAKKVYYKCNNATMLFKVLVLGLIFTRACEYQIWHTSVTVASIRLFHTPKTFKVADFIGLFNFERLGQKRCWPYCHSCVVERSWKLVWNRGYTETDCFKEIAIRVVHELVQKRIEDRRTLDSEDFYKHTALAIMPILASEALLCENKKYSVIKCYPN